MPCAGNPAGIEIPAPLDFNGLQGTGAFPDVGPGYASVKGTVDLMGQAAVRYDASLLATFVLIPKDLEPGGAYELVLEPFYTVGPDEALYVTGEGGVLDAEMVFGRASLVVIPEPGPLPLVLAGGTFLACRHSRKRSGSLGGRGVRSRVGGAA